MSNFFGVLTSPTATFERIRANGKGWVLALIVMVLLSVLALWLQQDAIVGTIEDEFVRQEAKGVEIDKNIRDIAIASATIFSYFTAVVSVVLTMFIGGLLLLLVNLFVRGEATYMQLSKVALYSYIPSLLSMLVTGIIAYSTGATTMFDVMLNAGAFIEDKTSMLFVLAQMLDPFRIWGLVVMIIGTAVMTRKGRGSVATWIVIGWLLITFLTLLSSRAAA